MVRPAGSDLSPWRRYGSWFSVPAVRLPGPGDRQAARGKLPGTEVATPQHVVLQQRAAVAGGGQAACAPRRVYDQGGGRHSAGGAHRLRRGEAAGLRWSDLDLDAGTLTVTGQRPGGGTAGSAGPAGQVFTFGRELAVRGVIGMPP